MTLDWTLGRKGLALCLAGTLALASLGCQQASSSATTPKASPTVDKKPSNKPNTPPKPDVGP